MADWAGRKLGKIQITELVARGGMAEVYTGMHEAFGLVAVKVMRGLLETDPNQLARFKREAEVVADLRHPHIVQMLDYFVEDETPCLVMEYIPGPSLAAYLKSMQERKQRIPIGVVAQILRSVASALDYAHSKSIIHRDIKPANVLLRSPSQPISLDQPLPLDVEPILTDFGLVRLLDSTMHTTTGSVSGTPAYMSPEQSRGEKVDSRTDIYSLGIMLYEMLAGAVPFQADTTFGMLMKHINEPPPTIKGISSDLHALLDRALAKDPALRYETAGEMANEFLAIFNGETISPGTLHIAEMARRAVDAANQGKVQPVQSARARWARIGLELILILGLAYLITQFVQSTNIPVTTTSPVINPNLPVGRMRFFDFNSILDRVSFTLNITPPREGMHYRVWLLSDTGAPTRDIGSISLDASGTGQLVFTEPNRQNLLESYNQIKITEEQNNVSISAPTGAVVYSSIFPPQSLVYIRQILVSFDGVPKAIALMQGLYYYSAYYINTAVFGDINNPDLIGINEAYDKGDEASLRKRNEGIINMIVGDSSERYKDYDNDGVIDDPGDGFGSLANGDRLGYLQQTSTQAIHASDEADSTTNIRDQSKYIQICIQNMDDWTNQLLPLALQLAETLFGPDMKPIIEKMSALAKNLVGGADIDGDGLVEPIAGECGADAAYEFGWYLADFSIFTGADRIPPTGK